MGVHGLFDGNVGAELWDASVLVGCNPIELEARGKERKNE